ncbi:MAG: type II toxin-antitoxin system HipA family toxin [Candidatus Thiodiazotropha lotti]|uniref:Toxin HipA n=1 Tax=Candidatus Thiodiazotropha endoloripes TaxID=1818881 RepID=A0A1E2UU42_9GAMM|nr:type II toxin-antitoxin system HipA family toxin [Candidatus Thiodiazotropha endoloripes]MCG7897072.1 type II toxin-antitoxin system HipA family toxin [Candidatus Thiodiazotropha weberae]MCG7991152.1 type II toxin-antitoxin system HipA family toxin [Candidatus Thiodiazotropha lotti]MCG7902965.1 type II toxin-antitoxin system HipA family toxin [Candidatus Thiodiazotropha weberae]MCG7915024.1 type II toxin-antitoxin system HipA family toxin [Candidatus Thiodiazotropha weberae]MCG8001362.1 typ
MVDRIQIAQVKLWDKLVGALAFDEQTGLGTFEFTKAWRESGLQISPLHLPISDRKYQFPELNRATYKGLPAAFADSLPDDFGNAVIDAWLARQGRDPGSFTPVERLQYMGQRGMGALEYFPQPGDRPRKAGELNLESLAEMAQKVIDGRTNLQLDADTDGLETLFQVGTSAGGARAKAVVAVDKARRRIRSGQVVLEDGYEHYLLKFDGIVESNRTQQTFGDPQGYGRMEYAYYLMARAVGIDISECELLQEGDRAHFLTRRFDRQGDRKLHYQSLCAMDHADYKQPGHYSYEALFGVLRSLRFNRPTALELYRRMVFNIVARNQDDHTKNFGFLMQEDGRWTLAPAFDLAYSYRADSKWVNSHQLTLNGKRDDFTRADLLQPAERFRPEAKRIIQQITDTVADWSGYAAKAGVPKKLSEVIKKNHRLHLN